MEDINNFPRIGNASVLDFDNSVVNIVFQTSPNTFLGAVNVGGFFILTVADILVLILRHKQIWIPVTTATIYYIVYRYWVNILKIRDTFEIWMTFSARFLVRLITALADYFFRPKVPGTRPGQKPISNNPAGAPVSSTEIPIYSPDEEFFTPKTSPTKQQRPTRTFHINQDWPSISSIGVQLWGFGKKLDSIIFTATILTFKYILFGMWNHKIKLTFIVCGIFAVYSYIDSVPGAASSSPVASIFDGLRPTKGFQTIKEYSSGIPGSLWSVGVFLMKWIFLYPIGFFWGFGKTILGSLIGFAKNWVWYYLSWNYKKTWDYASPSISGIFSPLAVYVTWTYLKHLTFLILSIGGFRYSKVLFWSSLSLYFMDAVWNYGKISPCANSAGLTALTIVIIAFVAWATQAVVDFTKRICPHICTFPLSVLTWQPVIWMTILLLGQYLDFFSISKFLQLFTSSPWLCIFLLLAVFKGLKICVHTISYYLWTHPAKAPHNPTITPADVTVIIPTVGEFGQEFADTVESILRNTPARIIISTVGPRMKRKAEEACLNIVGDKNIEVICVEQPDKRIQLLTGVQAVRTIVTVYADDHVIWPTTFLRSALAPFEDPIVGLVGTSKRVIRNHNLPFWDNFFNYIACIYLERHNFECTATYNIDGGVFVVSGRTALARTSVLHSLEYRSEFQSEFFTSVGPMKVDDDNFNTRFMVRHGYKIVFHNDPYATIETTLVHETGKLGKFRGQLLRWSRTTWRSNLKSLITDHMCYQTTPWTTYAMFISSFVNFALVYDAALYFTLKWSGSGHMCSFFLLLVLSKLIKPLPHLLRESGDWKWVTFGILFGYFHSFIKLYSMFTIGNIDWTGRQGIQARGSK